MIPIALILLALAAIAFAVIAAADRIPRARAPHLPAAISRPRIWREDGPTRPDGDPCRRRAFTLVELLVVLVIIGLISIAVLPGIVTSYRHRQSSEAARLLQGALTGARDDAIHGGGPSGIRLLPDPAWPLALLPNGQVDPSRALVCSRILPIAPAPSYSEGAVSIFPAQTYPAALLQAGFSGGGAPCLLLEQAVSDAQGLPNPPTSWAWNVRVGDKLQINNAGPWYTIVGPLFTGPSGGNTELFVNFGLGIATSPLTRGNVAAEYLLLADGRDDNGNGWIDEGWDGVDNNGNGTADELAEWETEAWQGGQAAGTFSTPYTIRRRPAPVSGARELALPTQVVIDLTTWSSTRERSRLPVNQWTGAVEVMLNPDGTVLPTTIYGSPASAGLDSAFYHFWLAERADVHDSSGTTAPTLPAPQGEWWLVSLNTRTGRLSATENPPINGAYSAAQHGAP